MSKPDPNKSYRSGRGEWHSAFGDSIKQQIFYHGYISRDDLAELLTEKGDFLVRSSEVDAKSGKWDLILSINTGADGPNKIRHFVLRKSDEDQLYQVQNVHAYDDPLKLIGEYLNHKWPLDKNDPNTVLKKGIVTQRWELKHNMVTKGAKLGSGQYGDVYQGVLKCKSGRVLDVAIKSLKAESNDKEKVRELMQEAQTVRRLHHPNIIRVHGVAVDELPIYIVMELCQGGSLDNALKASTQQFTLSEKLQICLDVAKGLEYLHSRKFIHRDVAARNCLYDPKLKTTKLSDFGLAKAVNKLMPDQKEKLPIKWLAPEVLDSLTFSPKSDVFAFGVLVWEIFANGAAPYQDMSTDAVKLNVLSEKRLQMPTGTPPWLAGLVINHCWNQDPAMRSDMGQIVRLMMRHMSPGGGSSRHGSSTHSSSRGGSSHHKSSRHHSHRKSRSSRGRSSHRKSSRRHSHRKHR